MSVEQLKPEKEVKVKEIKRKTLAELFHEPCAVELHNARMHGAFQLPGAGTESTLHPGRGKCASLRIVYHPGYGIIGFLNGKFFVSSSANMIVGHE